MRLTIHKQTVMGFRLNDKHLKIVNLLRGEIVHQTIFYYVLITMNCKKAHVIIPHAYFILQYVNNS